MKRILVAVFILVLSVVSVLAEDLTEDMLIGTWEVYSVEAMKSSIGVDYYPCSIALSVCEFRKDHVFIIWPTQSPGQSYQYSFALQRNWMLLIYHQDQVIFKWYCKPLNQRVFIACFQYLWVGEEEIHDDIEIFVRVP